MARTNLKTLSVYATEQQLEALTKASALERRSLSNFLLALGLDRAEQLGVTIKGQARKQAAAGGGRR